MNGYRFRAGLLLSVLVLVAGCSATAMHERGFEEYAQGRGERMLVEGIRAYESGDLKKADDQIVAALREGLLFDKDKVTAYKYLAFIDCSLGRERECREDFIAAVAIDRDMQLLPAEASHPVWGPIFRDVKKRTTAR